MTGCMTGVQKCSKSGAGWDVCVSRFNLVGTKWEDMLLHVCAVKACRASWDMIFVCLKMETRTSNTLLVERYCKDCHRDLFPWGFTYHTFAFAPSEVCNCSPSEVGLSRGVCGM